MLLWAQTYKNGNSYYREQRRTRSHGECPSHGGSISCRIPDEQIGRVIGAIELRPDWLEQVLERISLNDEVACIQDERIRVTERLRRLGRAYVDGLFSEDDYRHQKRTLEMELETLVVPEVDAAADAGELLKRLPDLWAGASLDGRHDLAVRMLDGVYADLKDSRSIVGIKPKPPFREVFRVATAREGSGISFFASVSDQPPAFRPEAESVSCSWWRRGRERCSLFGTHADREATRFLMSLRRGAPGGGDGGESNSAGNTAPGIVRQYQMTIWS